MFGELRLLIRCLLPVGFGAAAAAFAADEEFGALFREPPANATRPSVALDLAAVAPDNASARRQVGSIRDCGAGGVLVRAAKGDDETWRRLGWVADACRDMGLELGFCDFLLPAEEHVPRLRRLVWTAMRADGQMGGRAEESVVCRPPEDYREIACLAVPASGEVLSHQVLDFHLGKEPDGGPWRTFRFGSEDAVPVRADCFDGNAVFGHVNRVLVESQNRLASAYGTTLQWYQWEGPGRSELFWFSDFADLFLRNSGLGLIRHLPVLAGVEIGGAKNAAYVRRHVAQTIREAWRRRCAEKVDELVHEAGLEAGIAINDAPLEPEDIACCFRRVTVSPARTFEQRIRNERAAGASRALGHRFVIGRLDLGGVAPTTAQILLPFRGKHEIDRLFCDGANRLLLDWPGDVPSDGEGFSQMQALCRYAHRCQAVLQQGDAVCDFLVWSDARPKALNGYSCDWVGRAAVDASVVKKGELVFESDRRYRDVVVTAGTAEDPSDAGRLRRLAAAGVNVWLAASGAPDEDAVFARFLATDGFRRLGTPDAGAPVPDLLWTADVEGMEIRFVHRRSAADEIYYVANVSAAGGLVTCSLRDTGRGVPSRWDPVTGEETEAAPVTRSADGRVSMSVFFGPHESCFVVFAR